MASERQRDPAPAALYPRLLSPLAVRHLTLRNRIMQSAHDKHFSRRGGYTKRDVDYQVARARGGAALIVTGNRAVHPTSGGPRSTLGYLSQHVASDRHLVDSVHEHGCAIFAQLGHTATNSADDANDDPRANWGPSAIPSPITGNSVKAMEVADISDLVQGFALSAELARDAGFDGIELHFAHSYLVHQFISPYYNRRADEYGGSQESRLRLPLQIVSAVRARIGADFILGVRLGLSDFIEGGITVDDAIVTGRALHGTGAVDYLSLSTGGGDKRFMVATADVPDGWLLDDARKFKTAVPDAVVFAVGGIKDPRLAEHAIVSGCADMVAMTRAQIADPELARKIITGKEDEITHCIRANQGCIANPFSKGQPIACTVNPLAGREGRLSGHVSSRASHQRRWLVVGGGPAGMKAAVTLAERGHSVTLMEKNPELGGQVNLIVATPGRQEIGWITKDLAQNLRRLGVDVRLQTEATVEQVMADQPDHVIVATGARPDMTGRSFAVNPFAPALTPELQHSALSVWDVLEGRRQVGHHVVVMDDLGSRASAGVAEVLLDTGHAVEVVTRFSSLFPATAPTLDMPFVYQRLMSKGLIFHLSSWMTAIENNSVTIVNLLSRRAHRIDGVDAVVLATLPQANDDLYFELQSHIPAVQRIGDCVAPRKLDHAIYEGLLAGAELLAGDHRYITEDDLEFAT